MKSCSKCKQQTDHSEFSKNRARYDGYCNYCKACDKTKPVNKETKKVYNTIYRVENAKKIEIYHKSYYLANKEVYYNRCKKWSEENREQQRVLWRRNYQTDHGRKRHKFQQAKRRAQKLNATPPWVNMEEIRNIYENCPEGYHVDHIIPLIHPLISGLHVPWNLQYLLAKDNIKKNNKVEGLDVRL
jgi:hypothetical protein